MVWEGRGGGGGGRPRAPPPAAGRGPRPPRPPPRSRRAAAWPRRPAVAHDDERGLLARRCGEVAIARRVEERVRRQPALGGKLDLLRGGDVAGVNLDRKSGVR